MDWTKSIASELETGERVTEETSLKNYENYSSASNED